MPKRKKEPPIESKISTKTSGGILKAKNKELAKETPIKNKLRVKLAPLGLEDPTKLTEKMICDTPFLVKCHPRSTSTPMNATSNLTENRPALTSKSGRVIRRTLKAEEYFAMPSTVPLSPILGDISNVVASRGNGNRNKSSSEGSDKENGRTLSNAKNKHSLSLSKKSDENVPRSREGRKNGFKSILVAKGTENEPLSCPIQTGRSTRRRSVGVRRVSEDVEVPIVQHAEKGDRCSNQRVQVARISSNSGNSSLIDTPAPNDANSKLNFLRSSSHMFPRSVQPKNASLINAMRADWSSKTLDNSSDNVSPLRAAKRHLSPLLEMSSYVNTISALKPQSELLQTANEKDYSSSEEFESPNEKECSRSKRAPTWKDLSIAKSGKESQCCSPMKVKLRRLRHSTAEADSPSKTIVQPNTSEVDLMPKTIEAANGFIEKPVRRSRRNRSMKLEVRVQRLRNHLLTEIPKSTTADISITNNNLLSQRSTEQESKENSTLGQANVASSSKSAAVKSPNLLNKSNEIEEILSSPSRNDEQQQNVPLSTTNANCTRKFFNSRQDNTTIAVSKTATPQTKGKRSSTRKRKRDSVYEFLSQSSSDSNDPVADVIQKMINSGKVIVAKHRKGTGKLVVPRRKKIKKNKQPTRNGVFVKPTDVPPAAKRRALQEIEEDVWEPMDAEPFDDDEEEPIRDQRGFSELARSAMIKQAGRNDKTLQRQMITDKQKLLQMAQKFVGQSTPVRVTVPSPVKEAQFSPIAGGSSPWRVDDEKLPNLFYFNRNSDHLPSFSSDHIPSTPLKNRSKSLSSFSSNDSNGENVAPAGAQSTANQSEQVSLNPRRALTYRSPLKAINILSVVNIPSTVNKTQNEIQNDSSKDKPNKTAAAEASNAGGVTNLFGFDDMIVDDDDDDAVDPVHTTIVGKQHLMEQMQKLKRLRTALPAAVAPSSKKDQIKSVFDDEAQKQKTLKQMFCSTMIESQSHSVKNGLRANNYFNETANSDLFKDLEPETTFDKSISIRSYARPFKRKRKLRHNFVMFMDSDESEDDDVEADKNYEKKSKERQKKPPKDDAELNKFVTEFNEMCKEVSEYELVVE